MSSPVRIAWAADGNSAVFISPSPSMHDHALSEWIWRCYGNQLLTKTHPKKVKTCWMWLYTRYSSGSKTFHDKTGALLYEGKCRMTFNPASFRAVRTKDALQRHVLTFLISLSQTLSQTHTHTHSSAFFPSLTVHCQHTHTHTHTHTYTHTHCNSLHYWTSKLTD